VRGNEADEYENKNFSTNKFRYKFFWRKQNYTVNHKKRDILFLTITLANLNRFS